MQLRRWQSEAIAAALTKYRSGNSHFLCLATPGAGKTLMASMVARELLAADEIDLVLCFAPSVNVAIAFQASLEHYTGLRLDGLLGSKGRALTYQSMLNLDESFWSLLSQYRVFAIFDEIHHCSGDSLANANAWGLKIIQHIQGRASFTLALTGTPWRSDKIPIVLSSYCRQGKVTCDYAYGLDRAVKDGVCRLPRITAVDNDNVLVRCSHREENYGSFADCLKRSSCSYQQLLSNAALMTHMIRLTARKLSQVRRWHKDAGALVVAASVEHAYQIADVLREETGESACIATYIQDDAQDVINTFRGSNQKWIISVGMISEGTDIPRLRICCHLTRVKTELYFRQVLGRILRSTGTTNDDGYFFMPAEPNLMEFATRVAEDVPENNAITIDKMPETAPTRLEFPSQPESPNVTDDQQVALAFPERFLESSDIGQTKGSHPAAGPDCSRSPLSESYDAALGLFGRFREHIFSFKVWGS